MRFVIPGKPIPLQRVRASKNFFYDPQYQVKKNIRSHLKEQLPDDFKPFSEPLELEVTFYMPIPKAFQKYRKDQLRQGIELPHDKLFDCDNGIKFLCDLANNFLFIDDRQIWKISAKKVWSLEAKTVFTINPTQVSMKKT